MSANKKQVGGAHYVNKPIQTWDYIIQNGLGFVEGNIIKYVSRWREKGGILDLEKARHFLDKLIEVESAKVAPPVPATPTADVTGNEWKDGDEPLFLLKPTDDKDTFVDFAAGQGWCFNSDCSLQASHVGPCEKFEVRHA